MRWPFLLNLLEKIIRENGEAMRLRFQLHRTQGVACQGCVRHSLGDGGKAWISEDWWVKQLSVYKAANLSHHSLRKNPQIKRPPHDEEAFLFAKISKIISNSLCFILSVLKPLLTFIHRI